MSPLLLTRSQVAKKLGLTASGVQYREKTGELVPIIGDDGVHRFDAAMLSTQRPVRVTRRALPRDQARREAIALKMLYQDELTPREVAIKLLMSPDRVRELFEMGLDPNLEPPPRSSPPAPAVAVRPPRKPTPKRSKRG